MGHSETVIITKVFFLFSATPNERTTTGQKKFVHVTVCVSLYKPRPIRTIQWVGNTRPTDKCVKNDWRGVERDRFVGWACPGGRDYSVLCSYIVYVCFRSACLLIWKRLKIADHWILANLHTDDISDTDLNDVGR